jgi:hypothetical protein
MITLNKRFVAKISLTLLFVGVLISGIHLLEAGYLKSTFQTIGVYPEKEHFTSLFFTDVESLEQDYSKVSTIRTFTFSIHNNEERDQDYIYTVDVTTASTSTLVENGILQVKIGETAYKDIIMHTSQYPQNSKVVISLPIQGKTINFKLK